MSSPFPQKGRLYHRAPSWVPDGEIHHVRVRCDREQRVSLIDPKLSGKLMESVKYYHFEARWHCLLFLLMPDHWHALLAFPASPGMSTTVREWKSFHARMYGLLWQDGYFDHRIRNHQQLALKGDYIRRNPVAKGLCAKAMDWLWVLTFEDLQNSPPKVGGHVPCPPAKTGE